MLRAPRHVYSIRFCLTVLFGLTVASQLGAANITFLGSLQSDDQAVEFTISVSALSTVTIRTVSYGGDPYADVGVILAGGFDPYLTLFGATGMFLAENDDADSATTDPSTGQGLDSQIIEELLPGIYGLVLTQYGNYALGPNITDGFSESGHSSYTNQDGFAAGDRCPSGLFKDSSGTAGRCRTGSYAVEFSSDENARAYYSLLDSPAPTPEPGSFPLICAAMLSFPIFRYWTSWRACGMSLARSVLRTVVFCKIVSG